MSPRRYDRWQDAEGIHIHQGCRVEQVEVVAGLGALRSRLHHRGTVIGRGSTRLLVRFDGEQSSVSIRPHLVRVLSSPASLPLSTKHIITPLRELLPAIGDHDDR